MQDTDYRSIPLYRRDGTIAAHALVDEADAGRVMLYRWHVGSKGYARSKFDGGLVLMHRLVLQLSEPRVQVDHINRDRLDNRRANLRLSTSSENLQNQPSHAGSSSRFRGVSWDPGQQRWKAQAQLDNKKYWIGGFSSEVEAALATAAWRRDNMPYSTPDTEVAEIVRLVHHYGF